MSSIPASTWLDQHGTDLAKSNIRNALSSVAGEMAAILQLRSVNVEKFKAELGDLSDDFFTGLKEIEAAINDFEAAWQLDKNRLCALLADARATIIEFYVAG